MSLSPATSVPVATLFDFHTLCWNAWNSGIILSKTSRAIHVGRVLTISVRLCPTVPPDIWTEFIILSYYHVKSYIKILSHWYGFHFVVFSSVLGHF